MTDRAQFGRDEQAAVRAQFARGESPSCPRCSVVMTTRLIGGGSFGLGYARQRQWLICPQCHRSVLFDLKRGTRN